jgi:hypothetical protein
MRIRLLVGFVFGVALASASPVNAAPIQLQLAGQFTPPSWDASAFLNDQIDLLLSFDVTVPPVPPGEPLRFDSYVVTGMLAGTIGGHAFTADVAPWIQLRANEDGGAHLAFEMDQMVGGADPIAFPMLHNRVLGWLVFNLDFTPGALRTNAQLPDLLPTEAITNGTAQFYFPGTRGSGTAPGSLDATLTTVRQIPEPTTLLLTAAGLLVVGVARRRFRARG